MKPETLNEIIETLLTVREASGNESLALINWEAENRPLTEDEITGVSLGLEARWNYVDNRRVQYRYA